jgi:hypothetical protein
LRHTLHPDTLAERVGQRQGKFVHVEIANPMLEHCETQGALVVVGSCLFGRGSRASTDVMTRTVMKTRNIYGEIGECKRCTHIIAATMYLLVKVVQSLYNKDSGFAGFASL